MKFISKDGRFIVELSEHVIQQMLAYVKAAGKYETGGILTGAYSDDLLAALVVDATGPPEDSKSGYAWFNRGTKGLKIMLTSLWSLKQYYLGEWHYHPKSKPFPSWQDRKQMKQISVSREYHCPEPILMIIGGDWQNYQIAVFVMTPSGALGELIFEGF